MHMLTDLLAWWYGQGWHLQISKVSERFLRWTDYFSFSLIMRTLFAPFRQIAAGKVRGSIEDYIRAWLDRLVSRAVGFVVRVCVLVAGSIVMGVLALVAAVQLLGWLLLPATPLLGIVLTLLGWMPWKA